MNYDTGCFGATHTHRRVSPFPPLLMKMPFFEFCIDDLKAHLRSIERGENNNSSLDSERRT